VQKHNDADYRRRATALLLLNRKKPLSVVAREVCAARSTVQDWRRRYIEYGEAGLVPERRGRTDYTVNETVCCRLLELIKILPGDFGFLRSRWTSQMLACQLNEEFALRIHASTVRRLLPKLGIVWRRARPTLCIKDPQKAAKMAAIQVALKQASARQPVFYVDEADVDLNPRIGHGWTLKGKQYAVPTPGQNQKRYLAGALNVQTGKIVWVEGEKKNAFLFIRLLAEIRKRYKRAKRITVIADNYKIHKGEIARCFLSWNSKFKILFQPVYHPWVNKIELVWKQLHDTITRNHRFTTMAALMAAVRQFLNNLTPGVTMALLRRVEGI
jgi:transposase